MIDPPSQQLVYRLAELGLCSLRDFSRCRPLVRKLARDLPTFDIIWLDALVQRRKLTPFQANLLAETPDRLTIGPFVLVDELRVEHDLSIFRAQTADGKTDVCLSVIRCSDHERDAIAARLNDRISVFSKVKSLSLILPRACQIERDEIVVVEPYLEGPNLAELINRRGRFEPEVVLDIAGQLLEALAQLHSKGETHGDFRLANIILTRKGRAVLTQAGIRSSMSPEMTVHSRFPADCHNSVAPEAIGIQRSRTPVSDLYGLGCVLWHLLAGRPPFISADPLEKLVRHQQEQVGDISDWNPEAPRKLVSLVNQLTQSDAALRPQSAEEALEIIKKPSRSSRHRLAGFHRRFRVSVPGNRPSFQFNRGYAMAASLLLFAMACIALTEPNSRAVLLNIASRAGQLTLAGDPNELQSQDDSSDAGDTTGKTTSETWPKPDVTGLIALANDEPLTAEQVVRTGPLKIRGKAENPTVIRVRSYHPWRLTAEEIELENLIIELVDPPSETNLGKPLSTEAMVVLQAQNIAVRNCRFRLGSQNQKGTRSTIAWKASNANDALGGTASLENVIFANTGTAVVLGHSFGTMTTINALKTGPGAFLELRQPIVPQRGLSVQLHQTTVRGANAVIHFSRDASQDILGKLQVIATNCAFDLIANRAGFLFFNTPVKASVLTQSMQINGRESLLSAGTPIIAAVDRKQKAIQPIDVPDLNIEGIIPTSIEFSSATAEIPEDSEVTGFQGPRLSAELPGYRYNRQ